jgi:hypothetical protein
MNRRVKEYAGEFGKRPSGVQEGAHGVDGGRIGGFADAGASDISGFGERRILCVAYCAEFAPRAARYYGLP